jgi:hypothetical protein
MTEITIQLEEALVNSIGRQALEHQIKDYLQQLLVKMAAKDILSDAASTDVTNDPKWQLARERAWAKEGAKFEVYFKEAGKNAPQQS